MRRTTPARKAATPRFWCKARTISFAPSGPAATIPIRRLDNRARIGAPPKPSPVAGSLPFSKPQRIDANEIGEAGMQNGSLGHGIGLETPGQGEGQGVEAMGLAGAVGVKRLVELDADDVGYVHHREVEGFDGIEGGHRKMLVLSALED